MKNVSTALQLHCHEVWSCMFWCVTWEACKFICYLMLPKTSQPWKICISSMCSFSEKKKSGRNYFIALPLALCVFLLMNGLQLHGCTLPNSMENCCGTNLVQPGRCELKAFLLTKWFLLKRCRCAMKFLWSRTLDVVCLFK